MKLSSLTVFVLVALLAAVIAGAVYAWISIGSTEISIWGWVAMIGGSLLTLAVGGGLMALVFYSARKGYDDGVQ